MFQHVPAMQSWLDANTQKVDCHWKPSSLSTDAQNCWDRSSSDSAASFSSSISKSSEQWCESPCVLSPFGSGLSHSILWWNMGHFLWLGCCWTKAALLPHRISSGSQTGKFMEIPHLVISGLMIFPFQCPFVGDFPASHAWCHCRVSIFRVLALKLRFWKLQQRTAVGEICKLLQQHGHL